MKFLLCQILKFILFVKDCFWIRYWINSCWISSDFKKKRCFSYKKVILNVPDSLKALSMQTKLTDKEKNNLLRIITKRYEIYYLIGGNSVLSSYRK